MVSIITEAMHTSGAKYAWSAFGSFHVHEDSK